MRFSFLISVLLAVLVSPAIAADGASVATLAAQVVAKETAKSKIAPVGYYVVGSHASGNIEPHSDIDIVVIVPALDRSYHQSGLLGPQPYQFSVYGQDKILQQFESERANGNNVVMHQIARGKVMKDSDGALAALQVKAQELYRMGPYPMPKQIQDIMCFRAKSWLEDFEDDRPAAEARAIAASLYTALGDFYLRSHGLWTANGAKWMYRMLAEANPGLATQLDEAYVTYYKTGDKQPLQAAAAVALDKATCDIDDYHTIDAPPVIVPPSAR